MHGEGFNNFKLRNKWHYWTRDIDTRWKAAEDRRNRGMVEACQITAHSLTSNQSYSIYGSYSLFTAGKKAARSSINSLEVLQ